MCFHRLCLHRSASPSRMKIVFYFFSFVRIRLFDFNSILIHLWFYCQWIYLLLMQHFVIVTCAKQLAWKAFFPCKYTQLAVLLHNIIRFHFAGTMAELVWNSIFWIIFLRMFIFMISEHFVNFTFVCAQKCSSVLMCARNGTKQRVSSAENRVHFAIYIFIYKLFQDSENGWWALCDMKCRGWREWGEYGWI